MNISQHVPNFVAETRINTPLLLVTNVIRSRDGLWAIIMEEYHVVASKLCGLCPEWRRRYQGALRGLMVHDLTCIWRPEDVERPLRHLVATFRSWHPGRVNMDSTFNPSRVAMHLNDLVASQLLSRRHVDFLIAAHADGIQIEEFRSFNGGAIIMRNAHLRWSTLESLRILVRLWLPEATSWSWDEMWTWKHVTHF